MTIKYKALIFCGVIASAVALTALSPAPPDGPKPFLILRTIEAHGSVNMPCTMIISKSNGNVENFELDRFNKKEESAIENMKKVTEKIAEIKAKGYELINFSGGGGVEGTVYTYYFEKKISS